MRIAIIILAVAAFGKATAWEYSDAQIPNGSKFSCITCHTSMDGKTCNAFGKATGKYYSKGELNWCAALAALDSDGDGYSNGTELGDPNGTWSEGNTDPGDYNTITNPGNSKSYPTTSAVEETIIANSMLVFPNPASYAVTVSVSLSYAGSGWLEIYDIMGGLVYRSVDYNFGAGSNTITWDVLSNEGYAVQPGKYICRLRTSNGSASQTLVIAR